MQLKKYNFILVRIIETGAKSNHIKRFLKGRKDAREILGIDCFFADKVV